MSESILESIHESVHGMHQAGIVDKMTMRKFDALCLPTVKEFEPDQIKRIRVKSKASQAVFAAYLNTSVSTVQKWERGQKRPNGPSLKLLNIVANKGIDALA